MEVHTENLGRAFDHISASLPPAILAFCTKNKSEFGDSVCVQLKDSFFLFLIRLVQFLVLTSSKIFF